jgi:hypothetical protein
MQDIVEQNKNKDEKRKLDYLARAMAIAKFDPDFASQVWEGAGYGNRDFSGFRSPGVVKGSPSQGLYRQNPDGSVTILAPPQRAPKERASLNAVFENEGGQRIVVDKKNRREFEQAVAQGYRPIQPQDPLLSLFGATGQKSQPQDTGESWGDTLSRVASGMFRPPGGETKTINGVQYRRTQGGWQKVR